MSYNLASGSPTPTDRQAAPRSYRRHQRHARFDRLRHGQQEIGFINTQANRLGTTFLTMWDYLFSNGASQIVAASNKSSLTTPPGTIDDTGI